MTREEHLKWAKNRAMKYVKAGDLLQAVSSMTSDLGKHEAWYDASWVPVLAAMAVHDAVDGDVERITKFINGFG